MGAQQVLMLGKAWRASMIFAMIVASQASSAEPPAANADVKCQSDTNMVREVTLPKDKSKATIMLRNSCAEPYLWVLAHSWDTRKIEHGACPLKIEVNGTVLEGGRSVLQGPTYRYPVHPSSWRKVFNKYVAEKQAWSFKYDIDFVMNNQTGTPGNWSTYTTSDYNHWYAFDVRGVAAQGENSIVITECGDAGRWKTDYYDGVLLGEVSLCSMDEVKAKIADYERQQLRIDPKELEWKEVAKKRFRLDIPQGRAQQCVVEDGYIAKDGKPFFMCYLNSFSAFVGRESVADIYSYYTLVDTTMAGPAGTAGREIMNQPIYLKDGWDRKPPEPWEMPQLLANTLAGYERGILSLPYMLDNQGGLPYLEENFPETLARDRKEVLARSPESHDVYPNYAHPLYQKFTEQVYTVLGRTFRQHPGVVGYSVWEEPGWRLGQPKGQLIPQSAADLALYRNFLARKYAAIERLNTEWGSQHKNFTDIPFPEWKEQTANFVNFQQWRCQEAVACVRVTYETLKREDPNRFVLGQKTYGDVGAASGYWQHAIDNWILTKYTDVSREYSAGTAMAHLGRSSCRAFGKAMEADICLSQDGYRIWDKPNPWHKLADQKALNVYPFLMEMLFNENKAIHWEIYDLGHGADYHFIHYNKRWKQPTAKTWDGKSLRFEDGGSAAVIMPEKALKISRLHQWAIRNASLVLPAKMAQPQVAVLMSTSSRMIGYDPENKLAKTPRLMPGWVDNAGQDYEILGELFNHLHLKFDCVEERVIDNIFNYKVLIVGYQANVSSQAVADKIKEFVKRGGTVIFYPEALSMRDTDFAYTEESPGFGMSELCGAGVDSKKIVEKQGLKVADARFTPGLKAGDEVFSGKYYGVTLTPKTGGVVLAASGDGSPALVSDPSGRCYYFNGYLGLSYFQSFPQHEQFARLLEGILTRAGVEKQVEVELAGKTERRLVVPGLMAGKGFWLVAMNNFGGEELSASLRVRGLPKGDYEVVDISGERPTITKGEDGNCHLKPNFDEAQTKFVASDTKGSGPVDVEFKTDAPAYYSKVWLIRPMGVKAWVNCAEKALKSYAAFSKPVKIVVGAGCGEGERQLAEKLSGVLAGKGVKAPLVKDIDIKTRVVEGRLVEEGYELEKYRHEVLDDEANLILIGNGEENKIVKHLQTAGNYVYCKVPEMVTSGYPGKGRGIVQIAECVNTISYDATDKARDAVILAGSDAGGTSAAVEKAIEVLK